MPPEPARPSVDASNLPESNCRAALRLPGERAGYQHDQFQANRCRSFSSVQSPDAAVDIFIGCSQRRATNHVNDSNRHRMQMSSQGACFGATLPLRKLEAGQVNTAKLGRAQAKLRSTTTSLPVAIMHKTHENNTINAFHIKPGMMNTYVKWYRCQVRVFQL